MHTKPVTRPYEESFLIRIRDDNDVDRLFILEGDHAES